METSANSRHSESVRLLRPRKRKAASGFSLVEITMALGIIAFAFVTIFGLLPAGLNSFRKAMDISIGTQIVQRLINEAEQTDFLVLIKQPSVERYFDDQGTELSEARGAIYHAILRVKKNTTFPSAPSNDYIATVTVQVANNPSNKELHTDVATSLWNDPTVNITTCPILVARQK